MRPVIFLLLWIFLLIPTAGSANINQSFPSVEKINKTSFESNGFEEVYFSIENNEPKTVKETIMEKKEASDFTHDYYLVLVIFVGAVSLLSFFVFLLFILNKDRVYLYYLLFLICSLGAVLMDISLIDWRTFYEGSAKTIHLRSFEALILMALFFYCLFTLKLLDVKKQNPSLAKWITTLGFFTCLYGLLYFIFYPMIADHSMTLYITSRAIILPMALIAIIGVSYKIDSPFKIYFIIGSLFYFAGALMGTVIKIFPNIPFPQIYYAFPATYFQIGILLEIICFALALAHRMYLFNLEKQRIEKSMTQQAVRERDLAVEKSLTSHTQSNPHFIFNSLSAILHLMKTNRNKEAEKSLKNYSKLVRLALISGKKEEISLNDEIMMIKHYLFLESVRLENNLSYFINIDPEINSEAIFLPPLILMPYIEPLIWKDNNNIIKINIKNTQNEVIIYLSGENDRKPVDNTPVKEVKRTKMKDLRLNLYNKNHNKKIFCHRSEEIDINQKVKNYKILMTISKTGKILENSIIKE